MYIAVNNSCVSLWTGAFYLEKDGDYGNIEIVMEVDYDTIRRS